MPRGKLWSCVAACFEHELLRRKGGGGSRSGSAPGEFRVATAGLTPDTPSCDSHTTGAIGFEPDEIM
eukprot:2470143-Pyramimonas_sp.AAC.1